MDTINESINKSFPDNNIALEQFHDGLSVNIRDTEKNIKKSKNQLIFLVLLYFIIVQSSVESIDIGPFKIDNINIVIKIFPLLIIYKFYEFISLQCFLRSLHVAFNTTISKLYPKIIDNNIEYLVKPESSVNTEEFYETRSSKKFTKLMSTIRELNLATQLIILPLVLIIYAVYINFSKFGFRDILVWVVLFFILLLLVQSILLFLADYAQNNDS